MSVTSQQSRDRRKVVALGAVGIGALALLAVRDPHASGSYGFCPFLELTGWWCPLCGGLRATSDLTHAHIGDALSSNLFAVAIVVAGIGYFAYWATRRWGARPVSTVQIGARGLLAIGAVMVTFTIVRNLAFGAALAP